MKSRRTTGHIRTRSLLPHNIGTGGKMRGGDSDALTTPHIAATRYNLMARDRRFCRGVPATARLSKYPAVCAATAASESPIGPLTDCLFTSDQSGRLWDVVRHRAGRAERGWAGREAVGGVLLYLLPQ